MPHTRSAKKQSRKSEKRRLQNKATIRAIKTQIKKVEEVAEDGSVDQLQQEFNLAAKKLDKAAIKRVIHPNQAARKKSQLARLLHQKKTTPATPAAK